MGTFQEIVSAISTIVGLIKQLVELFQRSRREGWITDLELITRGLNGAKSDEERKELARRIAELIARS